MQLHRPVVRADSARDSLEAFPHLGQCRVVRNPRPAKVGAIRLDRSPNQWRRGQG